VSIKGVFIAALLGLLLWSNRDRIPIEYQFWQKAETVISVKNNSDRDIHDVMVAVWSKEHPVGTIAKGQDQVVKAGRLRDTTEVVLRFRYGPELIERHVGTLSDETGYRMVIAVNYAGVITSQMGSPVP
jgi:protoheme ferro-lyase